jgi:HPt (histidine-containing phosphotransfer) domain-containing protein
LLCILRANDNNGSGEDGMTASSLLSAVDRDQAPSVIDDDHLRRMTLGDQQLEREILEIFVRQIGIMIARIGEANPAVAAAAAHTLKGSARGIGAWRVEQAAERLEHAIAGRPNHEVLANAVAQLKAAAVETSAAIDMRLGDASVGIARDH